MSEDRDFFIKNIFLHTVQRGPTEDELNLWRGRIASDAPEHELLKSLINSHEYGARPRVVPGHIIGNCYSPIVDPAQAEPYWRQSASQQIRDLHGISIDIDAMHQFWLRNMDFMKAMDLKQFGDAEHRYFLENEMFLNGDALGLAAMINEYRPKQIIEIGSGYSTACTLDAIDRTGHACHITCIEPEPIRLNKILRPEDKITFLQKNVQDVPLGLYAELGTDDILFIDSSHVLKTGSDVHHQIFSIIPKLKPGVIIHFHDCFFPFEYPEDWVLKFRWALNEAYAIRAFLMYNRSFEIIFFNDLFFKSFPELKEGLIAGGRWPITPVVGQSVWLKRVS